MNKNIKFYLLFTTGIILYIGSCLLGLKYYPDLKFSQGINNLITLIIIGSILIGISIGMVLGEDHEN